ncbi:endonuclease [Polaribacter uvawellassae]|uniref:endonuclease n=1 Tax=Polaribacter uvawellassae TaxID=3133495 RepID=UPI003219E900
MVKKLLSFYFLLFVSLISFSQESYYNDVNLTLTGIQLKNALATKITTTHTRILDYTPDVWTASKVTDEDPSNTNNVLLIYGWENGSDGDTTNDRSRSKSLQQGGGSSDGKWNREHIYARSLATPGMPLPSDNPGIATDAHNLRPADSDRNGTRSNRKFGKGSGAASGFSTDTYPGNSGPNTNAWYPGDEWKGDVARVVMYMYLRYGDRCLPTNVGVGNSSLTPDDMIDLFLKWNAEDPVSDLEKKRNTYHEDTTTNTTAQGNRNPFIDNPYLATRIWGGNSAEDTWGIYTGSDTEAPTTPTNVVASNQTTTSIDLSWTASTDNVGVTGYNVYVDDVLTAQTANTTITISGLTTNTSYAFTIEAKDIINNKSAKSTVVNATTLQDTAAPTVPTNIVASNISGTTFKITWDASTDNTAVTGYDVFVDGNFNVSTTETTYSFSGLTASTTYAVTVLAKDAADNKSAQSAAINVTTTDGSSNGITELFISEYVEPNTDGNNKAIEIVNLTSNAIDLTAYSIRKNYTGKGWIDDLPLTKADYLVNPANTSILPNDVFVIIHGDAADATLTSNADLVVPNNSNAPYEQGSPLNFNGNDPVGLFKNGVLIDIVGEENNFTNHIINVTLRRKATISSPNATYDVNEWDNVGENVYDGIGSHTATLSVDKIDNALFKLYPNPLNGNVLNIVNSSSIKINEVKIYTINGKEVISISNPTSSINLNGLYNGLYIIKLMSDKGTSIQKLIKN